MRKIILLLIAILSVLGTAAQEAKIKRAELMNGAVLSVTEQRKDLAGEDCALVRVEVLADNVHFAGNVIGDVEHRGSHYRVYMAPGSSVIIAEGSTFLPITIDFKEFGIRRLLSNCVYVVTLELPQAPGVQQSASSGMNYLILTVNPANALVTVDGKPAEVRNGSAKILLRSGASYPYRVEASGYIAEEGQIAVGSEKVERNITLRSLKGSLAVNTTTQGTEIYVNGERMGTGNWRGDLMPGNFLVEGRLTGYRNAEQLVTLETGENKTVTLPELLPITGSLNVDYEPMGATITIDGTPRGTTPAIIENLLTGPHTVTIAADGYTPATLTATIAESTLTPLTGALTPKSKPTVTTYDQVNYKRFKDDTTGKWGFKDENGQIVMPAKFDRAYNFSEGLARVQLNDKLGFIDKIGQLVIPAKFDVAWDFTEGLCGVKIKGKWGFIDKTGKLVIPAKFNLVQEFSEGLAAVVLNGKYGFIDKTGELVIPAKFDFVWDFNNGKAWVKLNGRKFRVDKQGNEVK